MQITVVGGGVIGCAVAYELASRGARVRVLDPRGVGGGATRASAGILAPYIEGLGTPLLRLGLCSLALYDELVARLRAETNIALQYERRGTLQVALDAAQDAELENTALTLEEAGVEHALLDGGEARREEPALTTNVCAALLIPTQGFVSAVALTDALAEAARRHGAVFESTPVADIGELEADAVVIAAGSWSSRLVTANDQRPTTSQIRPIRGQLLHLRLPERPAARVIWGTDCYLVPWSDGTVLAGATVEDVGFDESATAAGVRGLLDASAALLPALGGAAVFDQVRVGLRPKTADELPLIGRSSTMPHVFYATGHYRNGILLAPLTASLVADLVLDGRERPELALTAPARAGL